MLDSNSTNCADLFKKSLLSMARRLPTCLAKLLLNGGAALTVLISPAMAQAAPSRVAVDLERFKGDVETYRRNGGDKPLPAGSTMFVGSSTFTLWTDLEKDMSFCRAVNRGFGGSTIPEIIHFCDSYITPARPARIVFYAGTNDLGELMHSGADVAADFERFVRHIEQKLPGTEIYFVSLSVAPCRLHLEKEYREGNRLIADFCSRTAHLHYVDVTGVMRDSAGALRRDLFQADQLHMTRAGYDLWIPILTAALKAPLKP